MSRTDARAALGRRLDRLARPGGSPAPWSGRSSSATTPRAQPDPDRSSAPVSAAVHAAAASPARLALVVGQRVDRLASITQPLGLGTRTAATLDAVADIADAGDVAVIILAEAPGRGPVDFRGIRHLYDRRCAPILVYAECPAAMDRILALECGADDWVDPNCTDRELAARLAVLTRRTIPPAPAPSAARVIDFAGMRLRRETGELRHTDGQSHMLPRAESVILHLLLDKHGHPVSRSQMQVAIGSASSRSVAVHLCRLRGKLRGCEDEIIKRVRGGGYFIDTPVSREGGAIA
ncbi:MAG: response regulator transcription factor [Brevundimonas sp.]|nr:MAG: response regulator transcription factor [Brevundimonas sp.]